MLVHEDIRAYLTPEELAAQVADVSMDVARRGFLDGLIPVKAIGDAWRYRCRYFERDTNGPGGCGIFETR